MIIEEPLWIWKNPQTYTNEYVLMIYFNES